MKISGEVRSWILNRIDVPNPSKNRCVVIGDAAHTIYPLSGQGFNLSLGDIRDLTIEMVSAKRKGLDFGDKDILGSP